MKHLKSLMLLYLLLLISPISSVRAGDPDKTMIHPASYDLNSGRAVSFPNSPEWREAYPPLTVFSGRKR